MIFYTFRTPIGRLWTLRRWESNEGGLIPPVFFALAFENELEYHYLYARINSSDDQATSDINLVGFWPVPPGQLVMRVATNKWVIRQTDRDLFVVDSDAERSMIDYVWDLSRACAPFIRHRLSRLSASNSIEIETGILDTAHHQSSASGYPLLPGRSLVQGCARVHIVRLTANSHRPTRLNSTIELMSRVGGVNWILNVAIITNRVHVYKIINDSAH